MSNTVITVSVAAILVLFAAWALAPAVRANRTRILRSPATWAVVVLLFAILWMQWEKAQIRREMEAFNASMELQRRFTERQSNDAHNAILKQADKAIAEAQQAQANTSPATN